MKWQSLITAISRRRSDTKDEKRTLPSFRRESWVEKSSGRSVTVKPDKSLIVSHMQNFAALIGSDTKNRIISLLHLLTILFRLYPWKALPLVEEQQERSLLNDLLIKRKESTRRLTRSKPSTLLLSLANANVLSHSHSRLSV